MRLRKLSPPLVLLVTGLVLALGVLGVAYGLWSKTLYIEGSVQTGDIDAEWSFVGCFDIEDKDVGTTAGWIDGSDPQILHFTIDNGYPSYTGDCEVEYLYTGSVPAHVEAIEFEALSGLTGCVVVQQPLGTTTATCDQLTVKWVNGLCLQLHQGFEQAGSLRVHVEQGAEMDSTYTFQVRNKLVQFNESQCP